MLRYLVNKIFDLVVAFESLLDKLGYQKEKKQQEEKKRLSKERQLKHLESKMMLKNKMALRQRRR